MTPLALLHSLFFFDDRQKNENNKNMEVVDKQKNITAIITTIKINFIHHNIMHLTIINKTDDHNNNNDNNKSHCYTRNGIAACHITRIYIYYHESS